VPSVRALALVKGGADLKRRYVGVFQRNAFARLWWWAEITHDPEMALEDPARYVETLHVKGRQDFIMYSLDCTFSGHRLLVRKLGELQRARQISPRDQQKLGRAVNRVARVVCLDCIEDAAGAQRLSERAYDLIPLLGP